MCEKLKKIRISAKVLRHSLCHLIVVHLAGKLKRETWIDVKLLSIYKRHFYAAQKFSVVIVKNINK